MEYYNTMISFFNLNTGITFKLARSKVVKPQVLLKTLTNTVINTFFSGRKMSVITNRLISSYHVLLEDYAGKKDCLLSYTFKLLLTFDLF